MKVPHPRSRRVTGIGVGVLFAAFEALAGGALESFDVTEGVPSPVPGQVVAELVGIRWDSRCIPVRYRMNDFLDPLPNPLGDPIVSLEDAAASLQVAMDRWNRIPTSFIEMSLEGTTTHPGPVGFDFVNEQSFNVRPGLLFIAASVSTNLIADTLLEDGDDLDEDGDADVSSALGVCADVDGDGDIELPAGFYPAGTILENDIQYNAHLFRLTVADDQIDTEILSTDLEGTALHELGHSHGLSHTLNNQKSDGDGRSAVMFPFVDTGDPDSERAFRTLDSDDVAYSSLFYPEGSSVSGPAALQPGDVPFDARYGVIEGQVTDGDTGYPVAGASVSATRRFDGSLVATGISGTALASFNPVTGVLFAVLDPDFSLVDGRYRIPVPRGVYDLGIEAIDGSPVPARAVSFSARIGELLGQLEFGEELYGGSAESALEVDPGRSQPVSVVPARGTRPADFVTDTVELQASFGSLNFVGFTGIGSGFTYAVAFPVEDLGALVDGSNSVLQAGLLHTAVTDPSVVPVFASAELTRCEVPGDGTLRVDRERPFRRQRPFVGQDADFAIFLFSNPRGLTQAIQKEIRRGALDALCLVLQVPEAPFPGPTGFAPFIGLDGDLAPGGPTNDVPISGLSFVSLDGESFQVEPRFNFLFALRLTTLP